MKNKKILLVISVLSLASCATGPILYPNEHLQKVGEPQAHKDIAEYKTPADQYVSPMPGSRRTKTRPGDGYSPGATVT